MANQKLASTLILSSVFRCLTIKGDTEDFKSKIKQEATVETQEEFLYLIRRLQKLQDIKPITDLSLFKKGIEPMWEDPSNLNGGKWIIKIKKNTAEQRLFESLFIWMALVPFSTMDVNGIVVSVRGHHTILSLWTKSCPSEEERHIQEKEIRDTLELKQIIPVSFKGNDESLKDKSSFRHTVKDKIPKQ
ncbi:translation initiation factor 4E [Nematocida sp. ERTm5]|nr:translation initiation factor 4E [Nematocida sp. AWRm79]KAI5184843.1 translation initiation factor 4E [Nematocida sp. AWRm78]OAG30912.1 translation initiation factor 4E [Nematocida sp. ERTm5]